MESPVLWSAGNKERELRGSAQQSVSSVRKEGSTEPTSQDQTMVAPSQGGRAGKGESRLLIAGCIFMAFWPVLL